jgi:hypothetical protein
MKWEGEAPAEPRRQRVASGEQFFLEGSAPALPKKFSAHQEMRPPVFQTALAGFVFVAPSSVAWMKWEGEAPAEPETTASGEGE